MSGCMSDPTHQTLRPQRQEQCLAFRSLQRNFGSRYLELQMVTCACDALESLEHSIADPVEAPSI